LGSCRSNNERVPAETMRTSNGMNSSFRTAFWAMCLGLAIPMGMFVVLEITSGGNAARMARRAAAPAATADRHGGPARSLVEAAPLRENQNRNLIVMGGGKRAAPSAVRGNPNAQAAEQPAGGDGAGGRSAQRQNATGTQNREPPSEPIAANGTVAEPQTDHGKDPASPRVVLRPELETEPADDDWPQARARRVAAATPRRATPTEVEPLIASSAKELEERLGRIESGIARLEQAPPRTQSEGLPAELLKKSLELVEKSLAVRQAPFEAATFSPAPPVVDVQAPGQVPPEMLSRIYRPRYIQTHALEALVKPLLTPGWGRLGVAASEAASEPGGDLRQAPREWEALVVHDTAKVLRKIDKLFDRVDLPPKQVVIDVSIWLVAQLGANANGLDLWQLADLSREPIFGPLDGSHRRSRGATAATPSWEGGSQSGNRDQPLKAGVLAAEAGAWLKQYQLKLPVVGRCLRQTSVRNRAALLLNLRVDPVADLPFEPFDVALDLRPIATDDGLVHLEIQPTAEPGDRHVHAMPVACQIVLQPEESFLTVLPAPQLRLQSPRLPLSGKAEPNAPAENLVRAAEVPRAELLLLVAPRVLQPPLAQAEGAANDQIEQAPAREGRGATFHHPSIRPLIRPRRTGDGHKAEAASQSTQPARSR
jgi:hypothetical protein